MDANCNVTLGNKRQIAPRFGMRFPLSNVADQVKEVGAQIKAKRIKFEDNSMQHDSVENTALSKSKKTKPTGDSVQQETVEGPPTKAKKLKFENDACPSTETDPEEYTNLPIFNHKKRLLKLIKNNKTLIILGETGSGKTTQIPSFIHAEKLQGDGKIAITQPRRISAISVSTRVAREFDQSVGSTIGYSVRFDDMTSDITEMTFLTDGMLLREAIFDQLLLEYTVIILDEAHERTINTDILFGIIKRAQKTREEKNMTPLKIIIMSATMDVRHFSEYFDNCKAVYLEGRSHVVNLYYTFQSYDDYQTTSVATFFKIHRMTSPDFGVLIFLTGQDEIESCAQQIRTLAKDPEVSGFDVKVFTLYASLPQNQQMLIFQNLDPKTRRVVIATNVAETSITIPGIKCVIDSGMVKTRYYHPATGLETLRVQRISQEQACQRAGRAGRLSEGFCYRLYTKSQYNLMAKASIPEIQRANLSTVTLQLLALGVHCLDFNFIDPPPTDAILSAFEQLKLLGAVDNIDSKELTALGAKMIKFPLEPRFAKILLSAPLYECLEEALTVVALLSCESIIYNPPPERQERAQSVRQKFYSPYGDHITHMNIYREFSKIKKVNSRRSWCLAHYISIKNIALVMKVRTQLREICMASCMPISSCGNKLDSLRKCLLTGLFMNVAELHQDNQYMTLDTKQMVQFHPSSVLHGQKPYLVLFTEVVKTSKCYLRGLTTIETEWLSEIVPDYVKNHNIKFKRS